MASHVLQIEVIRGGYTYAMLITKATVKTIVIALIAVLMFSEEYRQKITTGLNEMERHAEANKCFNESL